MSATPIPQDRVKITDPFFSSYQRLIRQEVLPYQWKALNDEIEGAEKSGCIHNFRLAAGLETGQFHGMVFQDSDLAKWLEAAAYSLIDHPDPSLEADCDGVISLLGQAQQPDGYLNSYYTVKEPENRFKNFRDCHELYCAGHLLEAAVAYTRATGKRAFLNVMLRYVDYLMEVIGPNEGQLHAYPGHEEIELALVKLYDLTGEQKYLDFASYFIDERGKQPFYFITERLGQQQDAFRFSGNDAHGLRYFQSHKPVREQDEAVGHSVRAVYLYSAMADLALRRKDPSLKAACENLFASIAHRRMYVTGGIGSTHHGEAFTFDYDLPGDTAYAETCAAIGLVFFLRRMLSLDPKAEYADVMERALYNGVLSGMALDGKSFFYVNPLETDPKACQLDPGKWHVKPQRQKWFACACCPPNLARLLANLSEYIYQTGDSSLYVNLFIGSTVSFSMGGAKISVQQESGLPFAGTLRLRVSTDKPVGFKLKLRKPCWCQSLQSSLPYRCNEQGYLVFDRIWKDGDCLDLQLDLGPRRVYASPLVQDCLGKVCLSRGPLIYCLEEADNGKNLSLLSLPRESALYEEPLEGVLEGMVGLRAQGRRLCADAPLYGYAPAKTQPEPVFLRFVPYFAWANRGLGEMRVFLREDA